jgi:hypothetical protein
MMAQKRRPIQRNEAVSEVVGFIIIMGIMMTGIAIVTLYGYPAIMKEQENANIRNMEKSTIVLQNDINSLAYKSVPYKETMVQIGDGTLVVKPSISESKNFDIPGFPDYKTGELQFKASTENAVISLENGAVVVSYWNQGGSAMLSEPRWYVDNDPVLGKTFVISLINLTSDSNLAKSGMANVQFELLNSNTTITHPNADVTIEYDHDPYNDHFYAWRNFFKENLHMTQSIPNPYQFTMPSVNTLVVKTYDIKVVGI